MIVDDGYSDAPGDSDYVRELKQQGRELAGLQAKFNPPPMRPTAEERFFSLPNYDVTGEGQVTQPDGHLSAGSYESVGIVDHAEIEFARQMHMAPVTARMLRDTVAACEKTEPNPSDLIAGYTAAARSIPDAINRRVEHIEQAQKALDTIGGTYAARLKAQAVNLPRTALDLLVRTVDIKRRVVSERPR
jgi:hypothetical protein